jgi:hypothetical protein
MTAGRTFVYFYLRSYSDVTVLCEEDEATAAMFYLQVKVKKDTKFPEACRIVLHSAIR